MPIRNERKRAGMLQALARIMLVPGWILAIAMLLKGYSDIGDGFAAGVFAALIIILQGLAFGADEFDTLPLARVAPVIAFLGLALLNVVAFGPVLFGKPILTHAPAAGTHAAHFGALELITAVAFDIAVFMIVFGFCVGAMVTVARSEKRAREDANRARRKRDAARKADRP